MSIGDVEGVKEGQKFDDRQALYDADVHRVLRQGIVGKAKEGAESIVLSGGDVDDEDLGDEIIYTGFGGRDPATGKQVADQHFEDQNQALVTSSLEGTPVRVIRGSQHKSSYSPASGYRYDGLYRVESYWSERGKHGYLVCRYRLLKLTNFLTSIAVLSPPKGSSIPGRSTSFVQRIVRDTAIGLYVKKTSQFSMPSMWACP